jgi:magnesium and cobalt transporter
MTDDAPLGLLKRLRHFFLRKPQDSEELIFMLRDAEKKGILNEDASKMMQSVMEVSNMKVRDAMIHRQQMVVIPADATYETALPIMIASGHSRFPVVGETRNEVLGVVLAKDLLQFSLEEKRLELQIRDLVRPAIFVPESKRLDVLLKEFRQNRSHMAIVVDEYGNVGGFITIEDVLEEIVGEIADEYDHSEDQSHIHQADEQNFMVRSITPIEEFNAYFGTGLPDDEYDTIGGLVLQKFSHMPKRGEWIQLDHFTVTVLQATSRKIQLLRFTKNIPENKE